MNYLHSLVANSNGTLDRHIPIIDAAMDLANEYVKKQLNFIYNVDILFFGNTRGIIPENHAGGYTNTPSMISISLDGYTVPSYSTLFQTITHECCHASRWQNSDDWSNILLKDILFEGMATAFEIKASKDSHQKPNFFQHYVLDNINDAPKIMHHFKDSLFRPNKNTYIYFIASDNDNNIPRWSSYIVGYYLAKSLMDDHGLSISDLCSMKYDDMIDLLADKLPNKEK